MQSQADAPFRESIAPSGSCVMCVLDVTLSDLKPDAELVIVRDDGTAVYTTARQLIGEARLPAFLTLRQVELCFSETKGSDHGQAN